MAEVIHIFFFRLLLNKTELTKQIFVSQLSVSINRNIKISY